MDIKEFFKIYESALDAKFCSKVIERFEQSDEVAEGRVGDGSYLGTIDRSKKNTFDLVLNQGGAWDDVMAVLNQSLGEYLDRYIANWRPAFTVSLRAEPIKIQKYPPGGHFSWHSDNMGGSVTRVLTIIWYLNTVTEGGETEYIWQDTKIKPKVGDLLICPVGWPFFHCGRPPINQYKYIAITQIHQMVNPSKT